MFRFSKRRRAVAERNLQRCFPEWDAEKRQQVLRASFGSTVRMIPEIAWCWGGPAGRIDKMVRIHGREHLDAAFSKGKGVLVITGHTTCMEIGGRILAGLGLPAGAIYRPLRSEPLEWYQTRGRMRYGKFMISKRSSRKIIRKLREGKILWYAPDQDFGLEQSAFAPFFGIQTATLLASHRLPGMTGCAVVPMFPRYDAESGKYDMFLMPALENFPSDDAVSDLSRINAMIEEQVRIAPEQYWWIHRRFKTRPDGEPPFYD